MPPVFGPVSPSPARLWSAATSSSTHAPVPSVTANTETSGPSSSSSTRIVEPAAPNAPSSRHASIAATASSRCVATVTPLPAASPSALITARPPSSSTNATAFSTSSNAPARAVGTPLRAITSFANALEPSMRAASADGPKTWCLRFRNESARPATSGASGPTTVRSTACWSTKLTMESTSSVATSGKQSAIAAMPAFPGAASTRVTRGILRETPGKRVLAPPSPDDQHLHERTTRLCSRAGPTPTIEMGTPPTSSSMWT